ncbi:hypothetical protein NBT05_17275 [Aquimarina sp. ERC-38]|uniref:hypothetical protein n=1 Tax=Aquimarina sp. ERC-38 TaxID=2949996 RepID=UPI00224565B8|nr:hypothetical protein [Aquimarina sp. ERC-38]UZO80680.1 hypothetical protein NBT05_17275 [Aquimarina sp. ERC-38]
MQKKQINTILLITVAIIWLVVIYKFVAPFFTTTTGIITAETLVTPSQIKIKKKDSFQLIIPDRDPFLDKTYQPIVKVKTGSKKSVKKNKIKTKSLKTWPKIQYVGFIKAAKNSNKLALVRFDGKLKRVRINQTYDNIKVLKIEDQQLLLSMENETKIFGLQQ